MSEHGSILVERILAELDRKGWSQATLSKRANLNRSQVNQIINHPERKPLDRTIKALAEALGVDAQYLEGKSDERKLAQSLRPLDPPEVQSAGDPRFSKQISEIIESNMDFQAFTMVDNHAAVLGIPQHAIIVIDRALDDAEGRLVVLADQSGRQSVRYYAKPFLFGASADGGPRHDIADSAFDIVGAVVLVLPEVPLGVTR